MSSPPRSEGGATRDPSLAGKLIAVPRSNLKDGRGARRLMIPRLDPPRRARTVCAGERVRGGRPSFLGWSIVAHAAVGLAAGCWLGVRETAVPAAYSLQLSLAPAELSTEDDAATAAEPEPEHLLTREAIAEPKLGEDDLPPEEESARATDRADDVASMPWAAPIAWPTRPLRLLGTRKEHEVVAATELPRSIAPAPSPAVGANPSARGVSISAKPDPLRSPPPSYPHVAVQQGWQGTTLLEVEITAEGRALSVAVHESSGHSLLDEAARTAVLEWRFVPAMRDGVAESSRIRLPFIWKLTR